MATFLNPIKVSDRNDAEEDEDLIQMNQDLRNCEMINDNQSNIDEGENVFINQTFKKSGNFMSTLTKSNFERMKENRSFDSG